MFMNICVVLLFCIQLRNVDPSSNNRCSPHLPMPAYSGGMCISRVGEVSVVVVHTGHIGSSHANFRECKSYDIPKKTEVFEVKALPLVS